jgi:hypothetical protein
VTLDILWARNTEVSERNSMQKDSDLALGYIFSPYSSISNQTTGHGNQTKAFFTRHICQVIIATKSRVIRLVTAWITTLW